MFDLLFEKYKKEVLKEEYIKTFLALKKYEKISLLLIFIGPMLAGILGFFKMYKYSFASYILVLVGFCIIKLYRANNEEKQDIIENRIKPHAEKKMLCLIGLLKEMEINVDNDEELDKLSQFARKRMDESNVWKSFGSPFSGLSKYVLIPMVTILISNYFKDLDLWDTVFRAIVLVFISSIVIIVVVSIVTTVDDFANKQKSQLKSFIDDIDELKIFREKSKKLLEP